MKREALTRRFGRLSRTVAVAVLCVLLMGGCYKLDMDVTVSSDDTVSGTMVVGISRDFPGGQELLAQMRSEMPPDLDVKDWSDDRFVGFEITYRDQPIDGMAGGSQYGSSDFQLRRDGDYFILGDPNAVQESQDLEGFNPVYRVRFTFPGEVVEGNGVKDGNSMEWTDPTMAPYAKAEATASLLVPILLVAGGVLVLAAAAVVVILVVRRKQAQPALVGAGGPGGGPAQGQPQDVWNQQQPGQQQYGAQQQYGQGQYGAQQQYGQQQYGGQGQAPFDQGQYGGQQQQYGNQQYGGQQQQYGGQQPGAQQPGAQQPGAQQNPWDGQQNPWGPGPDQPGDGSGSPWSRP